MTRPIKAEAHMVAEVNVTYVLSWNFTYKIYLVALYDYIKHFIYTKTLVICCYHYISVAVLSGLHYLFVSPCKLQWISN